MSEVADGQIGDRGRRRRGRRRSIIAACGAGVAVVALLVANRPTSPANNAPEGPIDLDGDGLTDSVEVLEQGGRFNVVAQLSSGGEATSDPYTHVEVLGSVDLDADRRSELIVRNGGETIFIGALLVLDGRRLVEATRSDAGFSEFSWYAHSSCCPGATVDVTCPQIDGERRLVLSESVVDADVPWSRSVYRLTGFTLLLIDTEVADSPGASIPEDLPRQNRLVCGTAVDPR